MLHLLLTLMFLTFQASTRSAWADQCPDNLVSKVQICFSDLARAVHARSGPDTKLAETGAGMTLDYSQIKLYCAHNGHMSRFVTCIEQLVSSCQDTPQAQLLDRLVDPQRVKNAVPSLCAHQDEVQKASSCMNAAMTLESDCKVKSYAKIKADMARAARNATAMFLSQCTFFHSLAECQRRSVSDKCGRNLGKLHSDFLLSFVPTSCLASDLMNTSAIPLNNNNDDNDDLHNSNSNIPSQNHIATTTIVNGTKSESESDLSNSNHSSGTPLQHKSNGETKEVDDDDDTNESDEDDGNKEKNKKAGVPLDGNSGSLTNSTTATEASNQGGEDSNSSSSVHLSWMCYNFIAVLIIKMLSWN